MHLHFERTVNAKSDCSILSLTWMGKVPDELPEDEGWKLNRTNYYQEGWLATGNVRGIVGVTFTTSHCKKNVEFPLRTNYNLRGHRSEVILVKWNEPYQKLASCDSSGIIFVWIKYEGRWSIELINDRNTPVTHFSWSHDGRMALICYQDGFVLVGSVAGQRYWSSMLNLDSTITCGIWTPDDQQVYFGTTSGQIIVMDVHGAMVSQVQLSSEVGISSMAWSCEKFKMEEGEESDPGVTNAAERKFVLAVSLQNGYIFLLKTFDDVSPIQINTNLQGPLSMEWSNSRELLAVAGTVPQDTRTFPVGIEYNNILKFYNERGVLLYSINIPFVQAPVSALTWGHNDKRLFLATGTQIHIAWVSRRIASLQLMCRLRIHNSLQSENELSQLPLPPRIRNLIGNLFAQTIRCCVPEASALREFVSRPPAGSVRLHCTMIRHDDDSNLSSGTCYTLYLEYLGGLVPLLKGKRTSKIRPEFVIFDPQVEELCGSMQWSPDSGKSSASSQSTSGGGAHSDSSDSDREEGCSGSPRMQRRKKRRNKNGTRVLQSERQVGQVSADCEAEDLAYIDTLPEHVRLVEVTSNIWGTKFKIHGLASSVPANLGQVTYKTSLLHLQPRQMTLVMTELRDDFPPGPDPTFNPNVFSEDEEEAIALEERRLHPGTSDHAPPIAPMSPMNSRLNRPKSQISNHFLNSDSVPMPLPSSAVIPAVIPALARAESYEDEFPYVELSDVGSYNGENRESFRPQTTNTGVRCSSSFVGQQFRSPVVSTVVSATNGQSRHVVSPLCCDGSVPALQSPKNAVAPSDIIFDRPPVQTLVSYSSADYSSSVQQVKSAMIADHGSRNGVLLNFNTDPQSRIPNFTLDPHPKISTGPGMKKVDVTIETTNLGTSLGTKKAEECLNDSGKEPMVGYISTHSLQNSANCGRRKTCLGDSSKEATVGDPSGNISAHSTQHSGYCGKRKDKHPKSGAGPNPNKEIRYIDEEHQNEATQGTSHLSLGPSVGNSATPTYLFGASAIPVSLPSAGSEVGSSTTQVGSCVCSSLGTATIPVSLSVGSCISSSFGTPATPASLCVCSPIGSSVCPSVGSSLCTSIGTSTTPVSLSSICSFIGTSVTPVSLSVCSSICSTVGHSTTPVSLSSVCISDSMVRSCSVGYLDLVDAQLVPCDIALHMLRKDAPKRLVLVNRKNKNRRHKKQPPSQDKDIKLEHLKSPKLKNCGKSKSLDSSDLFPPEIQNVSHLPNHTEESSENQTNSDDQKPTSPRPKNDPSRSPISREGFKIDTSKRDSSKKDGSKIDHSKKEGSNKDNSMKEGSKTPQSPKLQFFTNNKSPVPKRKKSDSDISSTPSKAPQNKPRGRSKQNPSNSVPNKSTIDNPQGSPVRNATSLHTQALNTLENLLTRLRDLDDNKPSPPASPRLPRSSPASPAPTKKGKRPQSASPIRKHLLASPLLGRRSRKSKMTESSDDEVVVSGDEIVNSKNYKDLETFQKAQLRQKLKRGKIEPNGSCVNPPAPQRREFVMHNKAPMWNENSQVYQLDFGGRVTQESAKNFQIEFRGKQVMQFGRIDGNAYTLDFQYPFSALQAFAVALANVTQRLK